MSAAHEQARLQGARETAALWKKWGPYLSERQWGTVREDYSPSGDVWNYFTHDHARSRAYRWGEDGLAGFSDEQQRLCVAIALWNGKDPILKERLFGLTNSEGNHGEDVKEYYFYLDSTPTHSYLKYLYKYPQRAYPYDEIVRTNKSRGRNELEYELLDTDAFDDDRYFDVFVEYAKASPEDILIQVTVWNRGPEPADLHVLPTFWYRNTWDSSADERPALQRMTKDAAGASVIRATHPTLGEMFIYGDTGAELLFTENETNMQRIAQTANRTAYVKDGINDFVVHGRREAVNPQFQGTKAASHHVVIVGPGQSQVIRARISNLAPQQFASKSGPFGAAFDTLIADRRREADEFYASVIPHSLGADAANVMRQALAGMLWSKQFYYYDLETWLKQRGRGNGGSRNQHWRHTTPTSFRCRTSGSIRGTRPGTWRSTSSR